MDVSVKTETFLDGNDVLLCAVPGSSAAAVKSEAKLQSKCYWHAAHASVCVHQLKHLPNVEMRFYCPQAILSVDLQCRELK